LSAPEYPRGTDGDDFDFDGDTVKDDASMRGGTIGGGMGPFSGAGANTGVNPHFTHMAGVTAGDATMAREKEEIDLRGRVLQEQLENRGLDP